MNLSSIRIRLADLAKRVDACAPEKRVEIYIVKPGGYLPPGKTSDDFDSVIWLSSEEYPHKNIGARGWTAPT